MKILIAEDNPDNMELIRDILAVTQHQLVEAMDGAAALEKARAERPDLILLDVNMPVMNGFDVCRHLKASSETSMIPVIMLTALSDVDSRVSGLAAGADDYLAKPFSPRELMARVDRSLRAKEAQDEMRVSQVTLRSTFERFVAAPIVEQLMRDPGRVGLGGKMQPVTVLFADLEGFTGLSERTDPEVLLQVLNLYHAFIVTIISRYGGTIDKFIGDGVMALYNAPEEQVDHTARAVKSALHIQDELYWFHEKLPPENRMQINFGIHTGMAVVGNVGTNTRMEFTAVGDTINVASRLQDAADQGSILVSAAVHAQIEDFAYGRYRGYLNVKGRTEPVAIYEVSNTILDK